MKKTPIRSILFISVFALMVSALVFCGDFSPINAAGTQNITLTIETSSEEKANWPIMFYQPNIDAFQKKYPYIKVQQILLPDAQAQDTLQVKLAAGEPSDLIVYNKVSAENELNAVKNFVDLSHEPWIKRMKQTEILKSPDGKIYGFLQSLPGGGIGVVYNKEIFAQLKLSIPKNYDEFLKVCETIKNSGITPIYGPFKDIWTFQVWTTSAFGNYVAKKDPALFDKINSNKLKWSDVKAFEDILQKGLDLVKKGYVQKTCLADDYANGAPTAFSSRKYAMMLMGDWFVTDMEKKDPSLKLGIFATPAFNDGTPITLSQTQMCGLFYIPKQAKHIKEAKLFLDFMSRKEQVNNAQNAQTFTPNFKDASDVKLSPILQELMDNYIKPGKISPEANTYVKVDMTELWKFYQEMIGGAKTPKEVLEAWDSKFAEFMKAKAIPGF